MMIRLPAPSLWLSSPSRYAILRPGRARAALAVLLTLLICLAVAGLRAGNTRNDVLDSDLTEGSLYATVIDGMRHGADYYSAATTTLELNITPVRSSSTIPLPTLAVVQAFAPPRAVSVMFYALVAATAFTAYLRISPGLNRGLPRLILAVLLAFAMMNFLVRDVQFIPEAWAVLFVILSLVTRKRLGGLSSAAIGLMAALVSTVALIYLLLMAVCAILENNRRELTAWCMAIVIIVGALIAHNLAVSQVYGTAGPITDVLFQQILAALTDLPMTPSLIAAVLPLWISGLFFGIAFFGWTAWPDELAVRILALMLIYGVLSLFAESGRTLVCEPFIFPCVIVGLAFSVDGIRDLVIAAFGRRRITVRRVLR